jgi:anti-sigma regulatory factor (Ser/Thr protein kinase)
MADSAHTRGSEVRSHARSWKRRSVAQGPQPGRKYAATVEAIAVARRDVAGMARAAGASPGAVADIKLAVSEASTNAVLHAYASDGSRGEAFAISTASRGDRFSVWVTDEGRGGPAHVPSPGLGLGLGLMSQLCERVVIGVLRDGRTQVEMHFDLGAARC